MLGNLLRRSADNKQSGNNS